MNKIYKRSELKENKPKLTIGTIGHVSHGKTTLMAAILKLLGQKELAERKRPDKVRGIEI